MASFSSTNVFVLEGAREIVTLERMEYLIGQSSASFELTTTIRLSNKSITAPAAVALASHLSKFENIVHADISDIIAGRPEEEALTTLKSICDSLEKFNFKSINLSDNALGSKGIHSCSAVLTKKTLESLRVCNNGLSSETIQLLANILLDGGCPPLKLLHCYNNMSGNGGASALGTIVMACPMLEDLRFSATRTDSKGCIKFAEAMQDLSYLVHLDLADNSFRDSAARLLASSLRKQRGLQSLNLRDAGLNEEGVLAVASALIDAAPALRVLDLSGNDVSAANCSGPIAALLRSAVGASLEEFSLDDNDAIGEDANDEEGDGDEEDGEEKCAGGSGVRALAAAIVGLPRLVSLSMCACALNAASGYRVASAVSKGSAFRRLQLDGNAIASRGVEEIRGLLQRAGKMLGDMEENDEDGDEDGLDDAIELEEAEAKRRGVDSDAGAGGGSTAVGAVVVHSDAEARSADGAAEVKDAEEDSLSAAFAAATL